MNYETADHFIEPMVIPSQCPECRTIYIRVFDVPPEGS